MTSDPDLALALEFLHSQHVLVLSTSGPRGEALNAPLFYVLGEGWRIYWLSSPRSQHSLRLKAAEVAVAVFHPGKDWREIRGVQMRGAARTVRPSAAKARILEQYRRRFSLGVEFAAIIATSRLYCFEPAWLRYIDNSRSFGFKREFSLP
ncbi:MAG: pyridoxamine 5'-phosphate oxidase family protein [Acidobacteria bacterium]|nr:pyridoxamine 5'-phosphate oxidase family protein [Acidobacteriota bacterium]